VGAPQGEGDGVTSIPIQWFCHMVVADGPNSSRCQL
jgi:hypothetical protein